jgi:hypothetical protein
MREDEASLAREAATELALLETGERSPVCFVLHRVCCRWGWVGGGGAKR